MSEPSPRKRPADYRPDLRPMLILAALLAGIVVGWIVLGPLVLPPSTGPSGLDGRWTRTPDAPLDTTLEISGTAYSLAGDVQFHGSGRLARADDELILTDDARCPDAEGRYSLRVEDVDRVGLLPEHRSEALTLTLVSDTCAGGSRAAALTDGSWTLRASGRDDAHGICDPPNQEAAISGHWPEPSGCR